MSDKRQPNGVGVRFCKVGKIYHFDASDLENVQLGDIVIVDTARGTQLGEVVQLVKKASETDGGLKKINRRANPLDLVQRQQWQQMEQEVVTACRNRARELRLQGVKVASAEYSFDGSRLTILYSTETEEKVDLKSLRQDMQRAYSPAQVELRMIGPRDVAKVLGGMGACGLETRCCSKFLTDFSSISIRMAKEQGISLTPAEITGMCGRLRCCLFYEYDQYVEARQGMPKRNKRVMTPDGEGKVIDIIPLQGKVVVFLGEKGNRTYDRQDIQVMDSPEGK